MELRRTQVQLQYRLAHSQGTHGTMTYSTSTTVQDSTSSVGTHGTATHSNSTTVQVNTLLRNSWNYDVLKFNYSTG